MRREGKRQLSAGIGQLLASGRSIKGHVGRDAGIDWHRSYMDEGGTTGARFVELLAVVRPLR